MYGVATHRRCLRRSASNYQAHYGHTICTMALPDGVCVACPRCDVHRYYAYGFTSRNASELFATTIYSSADLVSWTKRAHIGTDPTRDGQNPEDAIALWYVVYNPTSRLYMGYGAAYGTCNGCMQYDQRSAAQCSYTASGVASAFVSSASLPFAFGSAVPRLSCSRLCSLCPCACVRTCRRVGERVHKRISNRAVHVQAQVLVSVPVHGGGIEPYRDGRHADLPRRRRLLPYLQQQVKMCCRVLGRTH